MANKDYSNFDFDEYWRKQKNQSNSTQIDADYSNGDYSNFDFDDYYKRQKLPELSTRVNSWIENNKSFFDSYNSRIANKDEDPLKWSYDPDTAGWYLDFMSQKTGLDNEANEILSILDSYGSYFNEDYVKAVTEAINGNRDQYEDLLTGATSYRDYWSNFENEDAYKQYIEGINAEKELLATDTKALEAEIAELETKLNKTGNPIERFGHKAEDAVLDFANWLAGGVGNPTAGDHIGYLESAISEKRAYLNLAKNAQVAAELASVGDDKSANYDPNFNSYAEKGLNFTNPSISDAEKGNIPVNKATYAKEHADMLGMSEVNGGGSDIVSYYHSYMSDDEVKIYSYYFGKGEYDKADEYLASLDESLQARHGTAMAEGIVDAPVLPYIFAVGAGLDQFATGMQSLFSNESYTPPSATQVASGIIREDLADEGAKLPNWLGGSSVGQTAYDLLNTTGNMLPSILASIAVEALMPTVGEGVGVFVGTQAAKTAGKITGAGLMGMSAAGNGKAEMLRLGYSQAQATNYGLMVGAAEAGMEYLLGSIPGISKGDGIFSSLGAKAASKVDNAISRVAIKLGNKGTTLLRMAANGTIKIAGGMADEALEEGLQTIIEPWLKEIATSVDWDDPNLDEILYSSLLGALSSFALGGAGDVSAEFSTAKAGNTIRKIDGGVAKLQSLGSTFSADTVAYKIASEVNAFTDAYTIGKLLNEVGGTISEQNLTDIVNGLTERGIRESDAKKIAKEYQNALYRNMNLSDEQVQILENLSPLADVLRKNIIGANTTVYQRTRAFSDLMGLAKEVSKGKKGVSTQESTRTNITEEAKSEIEKIASEVASGKPLSGVRQLVKENFESKKSTAEARLGVEGKYTSTETGANRLASNKKKVNIIGVDSIKDGTMKVKLDDGSVVDAEEINFSTSDLALVYEAVAKMGVNPHTAWEILKAYDPKSGQSGVMYAMGALEAYTYGHNGVKVEGMSKDGFAALLSPVQKNTANKLGDIDAKAKVEAQQKTIDKAVKTVRDKAKSKHKAIPKRQGGVVLEGVTATLTDLQESQIDVLGKMAEGLGVTFHIFQSTPDAEGNMYYKMSDGTITSDNGWYDPNTGEIWIDLNAGDHGQGAIIFTAAHELTHFIKQWSPAKFKVFADFLFEQYGKKGQDVNEFIEAQIKKAADSGTTMSWDEAYEEVVADSCVTFLRDSKAAEKIAALREKDAGLANKIKTFLGQMLAKMRKVMADHNLLPESDESKLVATMTDSLQKLYDLWTDALIDAGNSYSAIGVNLNTDAVSPMHSLRTWTASEYVTARKESAKKISEALGVSLKTAYKYIDDVNSIAKMIADDRARLDYEASSFGSAFVSNVEYGGSFDYTTLCKKRRIFTGTFSEIQRILKDDALTPDDILTIRNMLIEAHEEATCGLCYVEGSRANMGKFAKEFIRLYKNENPDAWIPNMADVNTPDGVEQMRINHPEAYDRYVYFWNHYGKLKDSDPALFASQQKPKLYEARKEYKGEILEHFKGDSTVAKKNLNGGIRMQSFSDFEIVHLIDTMQVIMDMSTVGLAGQAYTKVPEFAQAFGNTGLKINLSLIAKGVDADGNLILDDREGMPHETAFALREKYSKNVGTIIVTFTDEQLLAAMADPRIDFIIPFHRSQWKKGQYGAMGLPKGTKDYTFMQNEKLIKQTYHEYQGRMVKDKASNYMPNEYWDFSKSGKENAEAYLKMCAENNKRPKFYKLLDYDGKGTYSLKKDGSTDGYWKLLIDFKMYDNDGIGSPQQAVTPTFNMDEAKTMLDEYKGGHSSYPVAHSVVDKFVAQYKEQHNNAATNSQVKHSVRRIVGDSGTDYGVGVYLDSTLLTDLTEDERVEMVKERIKELGGNTFTAYDSNNNAVDVHIVESSSKFKNKNGRKVRVYDHMLGYLKSEVKQEAVVLADELISTSTYDRKEPSAYPHDWLDNNGANDWDSWITYLQDKENTVWEATLKIANSANGEKILYEIHPIKMVEGAAKNSTSPTMVEQSGKPNTSTTAPIITQPDSSVNSKTKKSSRRNVEPIGTDDYVKMYHHFGSTKNYDVAGYILGNGVMLDFSGKHWGDDYSTSRQVDHRDIQEVLGNRGSNNGVNAMIDMIGNGNIRLMPEVGGINLAVMPNATQMSQLRGYINHFKGEVSIDIDEVGGDTIHSFSYTRGTSSAKVLADIKAYFGEGVVPEKKAEGETDIRRFLHSSRSPGSVSTRSILANALETTAQNDIEKNKLAQYKSKIDLIESEQAKLKEIKAKIKELSFAKGARDTKAIKSLQFEANQIANRINTYDRQLLNLESTTALKNVLQREKKLAYDKAKKEGKDALAKRREQEAKTIRALMDKNTESRKKAVEGRNKTEMRHKIKKVVGDLKTLLLDPTKDKHVPIGLQKPVAEALDIINMDTVGADERIAKYNAMIAKSNDPDTIAELTKSRDRIALQGANLSDKLTALKQAYAEIKNSDDPLVKRSHDEAIETLIHNTATTVGNTSLRDMSYEQLEAVYDMYKAILTTVRNANKMFKADKQETITDNSEAVKREVRAAGGHRDRVLKATKFLKKFGWNMLKPIYAMKLIGSDTLTRLYENVRKGEDTWAVDVNEAKDFFKETAKKYEYNTWDLKKQYKFTDSVGHSFSLTLEQIMSLYAYSKRSQADKHLELGGFIFDDAIEVKEPFKLGKINIPMKYEVNDANPYRLKKEDLGKIIDLVKTDMPNVKGFVDEMQAYLSDVMGAKGNEVSLAMYDIKLYKEQNYFPLKTAKYFREFDPEKNGTPKIKNSGFSKKTVPQAGNPIILSNFMDVWANHVNDMSMYHAFVLPLEDFMRVYNYSSTAGGYDSVQQYIKNAYGSQANTYIETLMNDLNGGARSDPATDIIGKGMSLFKKAAVFASASVVIQQPSAIARTLAYIDPKYFVDKPVPSKHSETWAEVKKYAPVAIIKEMGYFDTNMGRSTVDFIKSQEYNGIKEKFKAVFTDSDYRDEVLSKAPALADELAWCAIWKAVKREVADTTNLTVGSEAFLKMAGKRFTEVVTKTQVYDSVLSRNALMRSKDTGAKMITAFMGEPTTSLNMVTDAIIERNRGNKKFAGKVVGAVAASIILNSILVSFVTAARDDDDDETYVEKYLESLTAEILDGINPLTYIPIIKDIWSIAQGYDVERSDMSIWSDFIQSIDNLFSDKKSGFEKVEGVVGTLSSFFGLPLKNLMRDARAMYNLTETLLSGTPTTWAGIGDAVGGAIEDTLPAYSKFKRLFGADESKSDKLYDAIVSGDQNQIDRMKAQYKDDKAIESAIKQGLRENDSRIREAAQARYNGDIEEYKRIAKAIIAEGRFSQDTVVAAINAEINAIEKGESNPKTEEDVEEVTSIYKASDVNSAFDNGNTDMALEVIDELIKTKVANGMTKKEAQSSIRSSMTNYWKPLYKEAYKSGNTAEKERIERILKASGLYGNTSDVIKTVRQWRTERD